MLPALTIYQRTRQLCQLFSIVALLTGCLGSDNGNSSNVSNSASALVTVDGYAVKGPIIGGIVYIYEIEANGNRGERVAGPFLTDNDGYWQGTVPNGTQPYEVATLGGHYIDEASNAIVLLQDYVTNDSFSGVLDLSRSQRAMVTPFTHVALLAAKNIMLRDNATASEAVDQALFDAERTFGFDISTVVPAVYSASTASTNTAEEKYAALLGGFSTLLYNSPDSAGLSTPDKHILRNALMSDLVDGVLDGNDTNGHTINVTLPDTSVFALTALDNTGIAALLTATNDYAATQPHLENVSFDTTTPLLLGTMGARLLNDNLKIGMEGPGYFVVVPADDNNASARRYARDVVLGLDSENFIVDAFQNRLQVYHATLNGAITGFVSGLQLDASDYVIASLNVNDEAGLIYAQRTSGGIALLGQIALTTFDNPISLSQISPGLWQRTTSTGPEYLGPLHLIQHKLRFNASSSALLHYYDIAVSGLSYLELNDQGTPAYTQSSSFSFDINNYLVDQAQRQLMCFALNPDGSVTDTRIPVRARLSDIPSEETSQIILALNLNASTATSTSAFDATDDNSYAHALTLPIYDGLGISHDMTLYLRKTAVADTWEWYTYVDADEISGPDMLTFTTSGALQSIIATSGASVSDLTLSTSIFTPSGGASAMSVTLNLNDVTQNNHDYTVYAATQDGYATGRVLLDMFHIASDGLVTGLFSNGQEVEYCQLIVANFANPAALTVVDTDVYATNSDSGAAARSVPGAEGYGSLTVTRE